MELNPDNTLVVSQTSDTPKPTHGSMPCMQLIGPLSLLPGCRLLAGNHHWILSSYWLLYLKAWVKISNEMGSYVSDSWKMWFEATNWSMGETWKHCMFFGSQGNLAARLHEPRYSMMLLSVWATSSFPATPTCHEHLKQTCSCPGHCVACPEWKHQWWPAQRRDLQRGKHLK